MKIKEMVTSEMPRERLLSHGAKSLSNTELLAILINTGRKGFSSIDISNELLKANSNLNELKKASVNDLIQVKGIGLQKAITLKAAFELGERMGRRSESNRVKITQPSDVADLMMASMKDLSQEHFMILLLNSKNIVIKEACVFKGTLNSSIVHPREIFSIAIRENANAIIAVHNHPSGDVTPSQEDIMTTLRLKECGLILGIDLLDHIIIGDNRFTSLVEAGYFDKNE
ncbi:TPA: DNA repair protein RadC [Staphylococcus argenteus]|uniref:RadC family protein n=1 Tax=Staphylococcus argenteus TaxID=985002 RepID=UPI000502E1C1|nr:DNA repair protein RadC [Staphylococcus argenteus]MBE2136683.1 DNA repair protein RadC [Staphylococcus argenteus]MDT3004508.1 DNA repair protein RadC [Staphylococcus argenteus]UPO19914.1 DNA repair protein RadC [Staphylococcus argenteus]CDR63359.1 DNA repair RadC family protein [Staphylococcus argenteus]HDY9445729.1 DNA repair protein RadC [Staphylococcus argenteus]